MGTKAATARGATAGTACCSARANCGSHTCAAGYKAKGTPSSITCALGTCTTAECCDTDATTCGGGGAVACTFPTTHYWDTAKAATARGATPGTTCCSPKGTCELAYPVPGGTGGTSGTGTASGTSKIEPPCYRIVAVLIVG